MFSKSLCSSSGTQSRRVEGEEFTKLQNDDDTVTFLIDLGYKGPLHKYTNMYVDRMSYPCRTLAAIINKCLFGKTASNDRLRKSRIDIMWCLFYRENVNYLELIWEDLAYQIDQRRERKSRRENMSYLRFTKVIINYFLKQHKSLSNLKYQHYHIIKDDGIVSRLKFVRIGEDYQEYGLAMPKVMLNDAIKQGKGSQGKKTVDDSQETVDVSEESEPKLIKKKTASRRVVKKKVTIFADDNIIPDPDVALKLGKSISLAEAKEEEATKQEKAGSRSSRSVVIQDTPSAPKPKPATSKPKLKGVQSLTLAEKEAADIMQAFKESKKTSKGQPGTGVSSEGTGTIPGVPDEVTVIFATSGEGTGTKPGVPDEEEDIDWIDFEEDDEKKDDTYDDKSIDLEMTDDEETDDEVLQEVSDAAKADAEKTGEPKDDSKKVELPPTSSSLSISLDFSDQFLKLSSDTSLVVPHIQSPSVLKVPVFMISEPSVLTPVQETPLAAPVTTLPPPSISTIPPAPLQQTTTPIPPPPIITNSPIITSVVPEYDTLFAIQLRVTKLEKDVSKLNKIDHFAKALATLKSQVPIVVEQYLGSKIGDDLQKVLQRHTADLIQKYSVKPAPESSKIQIPTEKSAS
ncbi:hypothetical protein Tco_1091925 [Tanacetum coccineum]|uniref:Uncharacterized protein n=1 Tax=Tanacetum coccineum TaxID=301880 RepID=A0ABQ5I8D8_9ASTR